MDNLAAEIAALKARLADQTGSEMHAIGDLDRYLARSDFELIGQLKEVLAAHRQRRAHIAAMLNELTHVIVGQPAPVPRPDVQQRALGMDERTYLQ
jgi:hypothetical protein